MQQIELLKKSIALIKIHGDTEPKDAMTTLVLHSAKILRFFLIAQPIAMLVLLTSLCLVSFGKPNLWGKMLQWHNEAILPLLNIPGMFILLHLLMLLVIFCTYISWPKTTHAKFVELAKLPTPH